MQHRFLLAAILILLLTACNAPTPPTEFAPDGEVIKKALILSISQAQERLGNSLGVAQPSLEIAQINVTLLEPVYIANLSAYHLQGNYNLTLKLPHQRVQQSKNPFDIYLQRQIEGKSWRLLKPVGEELRSYLIQP
jgi:hypothetical protein